MAERRMFAKTIIDSDAFLDMPLSSQLLYFHLSMRADDEGFVNKPKTIMRMVGAKDDDINVLIAKKFIIPFDSGVVVIKHWRIHNYLQNDRLIETKYKDEKAQLEFDENKAYRLKKDECIQNTGEVYPQVRLGKVSIGKNNKNIVGNTFVVPTLDEVKSYCLERKNTVDAEQFIDFYIAKNWYIGKNKMKDWKAAIRSTWERNSKGKIERVYELPKEVPDDRELSDSDKQRIIEKMKNINTKENT